MIMTSQARYYVKPADAMAFAQGLLTKVGLSDEHAKTMAQCLVQADSRGVVSTDREALHFSLRVYPESCMN